jgi:serine/threonine protein kinase
MVFELLTGDFLFDPKESSSQAYNRDEDHIAQMWELLGPVPKKIIDKGKYARKIFNKQHKLKNISYKTLEPWGLVAVMHEKYRWSKAESQELCDFLLPMLAMDPRERQSASGALRSAWLHSETHGAVACSGSESEDASGSDCDSATCSESES